MVTRRAWLGVFLVAGMACAEESGADDPGGPEAVDGKADLVGAVEVKTLVNGTREQFPFVQDGAALYFVDGVVGDDVYRGHSIFKVSKQGGALTPLFDPEPIEVSLAPIAIDGRDVYWFVRNGETDDLRRVSVEGGVPETIASGFQGTMGLVADDSGVYFSAGHADTWKWSIFRFTGGATSLLASGIDYPMALGLDLTNVYFADMGPGNPAIGCTPGEGTIETVGKSGGPVLTLASGQGCPLDLAVDATSVYWVNWMVYPALPGPASRPPLMKVGKWGGTPRLVTMGAQSVALDATTIWWTSDHEALVRARKAFGVPLVLTQPAQQRPVVDDTYVYFWRDDAICRAPKR